MAKFNEILSGRYNRALQKLFSMKGAVPAAQLATEIAPNVTMFYGVENRYLESWDRYAGSLNAPLVAGARSAVQIRNPLNSNVIAVFEKIQPGISTASAAPAFVSMSQGALTTDLTNVFTGFRLDKRGRPNSTLIPSATAAAGVGDLGAVQLLIPVVAATGASFQSGSFQDVILDENMEWPLLPGEGLRWAVNLVSQGTIVSLIWRERALEESELV